MLPDRERPFPRYPSGLLQTSLRMANQFSREAFMHDRAFRFMGVIVEGKDSCGWCGCRVRCGNAVLFVALVLLLVLPNSVSAQATATLNGVVRDSSAAVIPQATVTLHNTDTGADRESLTNDSGLYVFVSVPPGEYVLKVTKDGFTTATQAAHVVVNQASTQDFTL